MYTIYINNRPLYLVESLDDIERITPQTEIVEYEDNMQDMLAEYIQLLESEKSIGTLDAIVLSCPNIELLQRDIWAQFKHIEAAGGIVKNQENKILAIYRRGSWDMAKGKIDPGETPPVAAVREVQEETGLQQIKLGKLIGKTYHTYRNRKEKLVLKTTWWYAMETTETNLTPQTEEDIDEATWLTIDEFINKTPIYPNILEIFDQYNN